MWDRRAKVLKINDGDTLVALLDQGFGDTKEITVRLLGVWAPELNQTGGPETKEFVVNWLDGKTLAGTTWSFIITTARMKTVDREQKTFDRYVATLTTMDNSYNLNVDVMDFVMRNNYAGGSGS